MLIEAYRSIRAHLLQRLIPAGRGSFDLTNGVEVVGYPSRPAGIAEAARLCVDALRIAGHRVTVRDLDAATGGPKERTQPKVRIVHLNPPMMPRGIWRLGIRAYARGFNIAYWNWELEALPAEWIRALRYVDAVLVPSEFTRRAIAAHARVPVVVVPHPVRAEGPCEPVRAALGIGPEAFLVSAIFNVGSSFERKNPLAVIAAFRALAAVVPDARLVLKTSDLDRASDEGRVLVDALADLPGAQLISDRWSIACISGLIADSDAYLSLHRSEGYGLTIAEAIARGTPVVATGWSGNVDFCDPRSTWLVGSTQVAVDATHPEFRGMRGATWADPDAAEAGRHLIAIASDRAAAHDRAHQARAFLVDWLDTHDYARALATIGAEAGAHRNG